MIKPLLIAILLIPATAAQQPSPGEILVHDQPGNQWYEGPATTTAISPDGEWALVSSWGRGVRLVSLKNGKEDPQRLAVGFDSEAEAGVFCGSGKLALLGRRGPEHAWFISDGQALQPTGISSESSLQCSPDGTAMAYWSSYAEDGLFVTQANKISKYKLPGRVTGVAFSSAGDGIYVSVFRPNGLTALVRVSGAKGPVAIVADGLDGIAPDMFSSLALTSDGRRVFIALVGDGKPDNEARHQPAAQRQLKIYQIDSATGERRLVSQSEGQDNFGPVIANGHLYWTRNLYHAAVALLPIDGGDAKEVVAGGEYPTWSPDSRRISYLVGGWRLADWALNLDAAVVAIDASAGKAGAPTPIIAGYHEDFPPAWSPDGRWIAFHSHRSKTAVPAMSSAGSTDDIYLRRADDPGSREIRLTSFGWEAGAPTWSPDGKKLMFRSWEKGGRPEIGKIFILTLDPASGRVLKTDRLPLPSQIHSATCAAWSPDGREIAFEDNRGGEDRSLWVADSGGGSPRKLLDYKGSADSNRVDWTADGRSIVYSAIADGRAQLFAVPREGGKPRQLSHDSANLLHPRVSPDGKWVACTRVIQSQQIWRKPL